MLNMLPMACQRAATSLFLLTKTTTLRTSLIYNSSTSMGLMWLRNLSTPLTRPARNLSNKNDDETSNLFGNASSLKDQLFNEDQVSLLAEALKLAYPPFPAQKFHKIVMMHLDVFGLKQRIAYISECMYLHLPNDDYAMALEILLKSLPPKLDPTKTDNDFGDFIWAPHSHFVATYGCHADHLDKSLMALYEMTQRFTAEFAIRPFLDEFPDETMRFLEDKCVPSSNYHVRRLASEGTRPKLPWASGLTSIPLHRPVASILERLVCDETPYVARSVANHMNDITKFDAPFAMETLERWRERYKEKAPHLKFITEHALRTLVKQSYSPALEMLGYTTSPSCSVVKLTVPDSVEIGTGLEFSVEIKAHRDQVLWIQYAIQFNSSKQVLLQPRVFQWKKVQVQANEIISFRKLHSLRQMSTRKLHAGQHMFILRVNGQDMESEPFTLK